MHGALGTLRWNCGGRGTEQPRLERQVHVAHFPIARLAEFNAKAKEIGALAISQLENWLVTRQKPELPSASTARVGVNLVAYVEAPARTRQSPPKPARKRRS